MLNNVLIEFIIMMMISYTVLMNTTSGLFGIVLAVLVLTALSTVVQTVRADDAHASPPPQASDSPGYQNGVAGPCDVYEGSSPPNAPPSDSDGIQPGNSEQNPVFSHCD
jgi:hypothetical protein